MMRGLPEQLNKRCNHILRECQGFKDKELLTALFVTTDLELYQAGLPEADNVRAHVTKVINYLLKEETIDGRSVFVLFLEQLLDHETRASLRYKNLQNIINEIRRALRRQKVIVPFVTVAMTCEEAKRLSEESAFNDLAAPIEQRWFQELSQTWPPDKISGLLAHYGESREAWIPDTQKGHTIEQIVWDMTKHFKQSPEQYGLLIEPDFRSIHFFAEDQAYDTRLRASCELSLGSVLIVDTLSLFHPVIYRRVLQSELGANDNVAIAICKLSPFVSGQKQVPLIEEEIKRRMQRAFARSKWDEQKWCRDVKDMDGLRRWIKENALPKVVDIIIKQEDKGPNLEPMSQMPKLEPTEPRLGKHFLERS